jgi:hypothetical protein
MCKEYNGYTNYETWAVALWKDNDYGTYMHYQEVAQELLDECDGDKDEAIRLLADKLKADHEESNPLGDGASVYTDLLGAALGAVNWYEIAENQYED